MTIRKQPPPADFKLRSLDSPLTAAQREFANVLGNLLAEQWLTLGSTMDASAQTPNMSDDSQVARQEDAKTEADPESA